MQNKYKNSRSLFGERLFYGDMYIMRRNLGLILGLVASLFLVASSSWAAQSTGASDGDVRTAIVLMIAIGIPLGVWGLLTSFAFPKGSIALHIMTMIWLAQSLFCAAFMSAWTHNNYNLPVSERHWEGVKMGLLSVFYPSPLTLAIFLIILLLYLLRNEPLR